MMNVRTVFALATFFGLGVTLLILASPLVSHPRPRLLTFLQSCVLTDKEGHKANAWPLLIGALPAREGGADGHAVS